MIKKVNLLAPDGEFNGGPDNQAPELLRLGENQQAVMLFTYAPQGVELHYYEGELNCYALCNGKGCVGCLAGRKKESKLLLPVYDPLSRAIAVMPMSSNRRPTALAPQIRNLLSGPKPAITLITHDGHGKFLVESRPLPPDSDAGEALIAEFVKHYDADEIDLSTLYATVSNEELRQDPHIKTILRLKGLDGGNG